MFTIDPDLRESYPATRVTQDKRGVQLTEKDAHPAFRREILDLDKIGQRRVVPTRRLAVDAPRFGDQLIAVALGGDVADDRSRLAARFLDSGDGGFERSFQRCSPSSSCARADTLALLREQLRDRLADSATRAGLRLQLYPAAGPFEVSLFAADFYSGNEAHASAAFMKRDNQGSAKPIAPRIGGSQEWKTGEARTHGGFRILKKSK